MKKKIRFLIVCFFVAVFLLPSLIPASAEEDLTEIMGPYVLFRDDRAFENVQQIQVPFQVVFHKNVCKYDFPYTDDFFRYSSDEFSRLFAQASMGLTVSAFNNDEDVMENQQSTYLSAAGFSDIYTFGYSETSPETLSGVIAHKKIDDFTLIACAPCGQGYKKEWGGNLMVGDEERHVGFAIGASIMQEQITQYKTDHNITGKMKIWITGFSRAAAVANITAADLIQSGVYADVYAYLFGVPRTTRKPVLFKNIFNICGKYDPVPNVPLQEWDFARYGCDLYTPSQETDSDYSTLKPKVSEVYASILGDNFRNNPEVNHQLHLLLEFLGDLFPTPKDYTDKVQGEIMKIWTEANPAQIFQILTITADKLKALDKKTAYSSEVFIEYISYIASTYLNDNRNQVEAGSWDANASMAENFLREHQPLTYLSWLYCDAPIEDILYGNDITRLFVIDGNVDVEVWQEDIFIGSITRNGKVYMANRQRKPGDPILPEISMVRSGEETSISIPTDEEYQLHIITGKEQTVLYFDNVYISWLNTGIGDVENITHMTEGVYELRFEKWNEMPLMTPIMGKIIAELSSPLEYSPLFTMAMESSATKHLNLLQTLQEASYLGMFVVALLLACLVIAIVHHRKKKKGHPPYSAWWVIIPHLIFIAIFAFVTLFATRHLSGIMLAKNLAAGLALRALIRNRTLFNLIVAAGLFALTVLSTLVYAQSMLGIFSVLNAVIYGVCIVVLTLLAGSDFFRKKTPKTDNN